VRGSRSTQGCAADDDDDDKMSVTERSSTAKEWLIYLG